MPFTPLKSLPRQTFPGGQSLRRVRRHLWPTFIILLQLLILTFAWGFVGTVFYQEQIALPDSTANFINSQPSDTTLIVTLLATVLSVLSTFLFTTAIRIALTRRLSQPLQISSLSAGIELSKGSFILSSRHAQWTLATLFCSVMLRTLTAGWTTLLTPMPILLSLQMTGQEINLGSAVFLNHFATQTGYPSGPSPEYPSPQSPLLGGYMPQQYTGELVPYIWSSGNSATLRGTELPSFVVYGGSAYNYSTGGVLANNAEDGSHYGNAAVLSGSGARRQGLSTNYTIVQQGLTADVSCRPQNLPDTDVYPMRISFNQSDLHSDLSIPQFNFDSSANYTLQTWDWVAQCMDDSYSVESTLVTIGDSSGELFGSGAMANGVCPYQNFAGPSNQSFIILLQGAGANQSYGGVPFSAACEVTPLLTTASVDFNGGIINVHDVTNTVPLESDGTNGYLGYAISDQIHAAFYFAHYPYGNSVADAIAANCVVNGALNMERLELFMQGVVEIMATSFRALYTVNGTFSENNITSDMITPVTGNMYIETIGWTYHSPTYLLVLIPMTTIGILTVVAMVYGWRDAKGGLGQGVVDGSLDDDLEEDVSFNPTNSLHIIMASSAGGLDSALKGFTTTAISTNENLKIRLGVLSDGRTALVLDDMTTKLGKSPSMTDSFQSG